MGVTKWTTEMLAAEAAKYQTRSEFWRGSSAAYQNAYRRKLLDQICAHMTAQYVTWTDEMLAAEAAKYQTRIEFQRGNKSAYQAAYSRKLFDQICRHMTGNTQWTTEMLAAEAAKYQTRSEFWRGNGNAYSIAQKRNLIDQICGHMTAQFQWTTEMLAAEAAKYQTRIEFQRGNSSAYQIACNRKLLDQICAHMVDGFTSSDNDAIYIWRAVRMSYNGESVYKIGVTSARLGTRRIEQVAQSAGFDYELILCQPVQGKATDLEKKLHLLGEDPKLDGFNGSTEFRALSDSALATAVAMINLNVQE